MKVRVYDDRVEITSGEMEGFCVLGPFHNPEERVITFMGKGDLRKVLRKILTELDKYQVEYQADRDHVGPISHGGPPKMYLAQLSEPNKSASELVSIAADLLLEASEPEPEPLAPVCTCDHKGPALFLKIGGKTNVSNHRHECPSYKYLYDRYASEK
jgi:hypothetical protein